MTDGLIPHQPPHLFSLFSKHSCKCHFQAAISSALTFTSEIQINKAWTPSIQVLSKSSKSPPMHFHCTGNGGSPELTAEPISGN
uniref:Uncharacterized protein n=1 Tax=Coturnix japonica TaxID=93934 RepID=A0A8C2T3R5_COTJA